MVFNRPMKADLRLVRNPFAKKTPARVDLNLDPVSLKLDRVQLGSTPISEAMTPAELLSFAAQMRAFQKGTPAFPSMSTKRQAAMLAAAALRS